MKHLLYVLVLMTALGTVIYGCNTNRGYNKKAARNALDLSARDTTVSPADDFYAYANGTWLKHTKIPASKSAWGSFNTVHDRVLVRMHAILDSADNLNNPKQGSIAQQTGAMYLSAMDSATIEKAGIQPLESDLKHITSIKTPEDVLQEVAREYKNGRGTMFSFYVAPDDKHSMIERVHLSQGGLGLPNRNYYFKKNKRFKKIRSAYRDYIAKILSLSGDQMNTAGKKADQIMDLETRMAKASKPPVELRNPLKNYHIMTVEKLHREAPNISWQQIFTQLDVDIDTVQVGQPAFYQTLSQLVQSTPVSVWKNYLQFHLVSSYASWLSSPFAKANFDFYHRLLNGQKEPQKRWKRASSLVDHTLGDALGQLYVERYFPPKDKKYMNNLVDNLQATLRQRLKHEPWMSDSTRAKAVTKLNAIVKKIGYPNEWKDYSSIDIDSTHIIKNLKHYGQWHYQYMIDKLGKPTDRHEWFMTPPTVNAYYNPSFNEIVFPAGILQPPFYFSGADDAVNYGAIGMVIGHEMSHGFDDQGSQYDKKGNLHNWWTKKDSIRFRKLTQQLVKQYDQYTVLDSLHVNGELTLGENIGDNSGLAIAYAAFQRTEEAKSGKKISGLTPDQRFFLAYAQVWRVKRRPQRTRLLIRNDPHSPPKYRVIGPASNMTAFYKAFNVQPSDSMYRPDSLRITIW
jgi:putative endopeptidase